MVAPSRIGPAVRLRSSFPVDFGAFARTAIRWKVNRLTPEAVSHAGATASMAGGGPCPAVVHQCHRRAGRVNSTSKPMPASAQTDGSGTTPTPAMLKLSRA
jgi:hypothetical protein